MDSEAGEDSVAQHQDTKRAQPGGGQQGGADRNRLRVLFARERDWASARVVSTELSSRSNLRAQPGAAPPCPAGSHPAGVRFLPGSEHQMPQHVVLSAAAAPWMTTGSDTDTDGLRAGYHVSSG